MPDDRAVSTQGGDAARDDDVPVADIVDLTPPDVVARKALERARAAARARGIRPGVRRRREVVEPQLGAPGRDPQLLGDAAQSLLAEHGWTEEVAVGGVMGRWAEIVGEQVAAHCTPETFEDGRLVLRADSSAWATHLQMLTSQVLGRIDAELGEGVVTHVTVLGPVGPSFKRGPRTVPGRGPRDTWV